MIEVRALGELADEAGYGRADLAFLAGLTKPTVGSLWSDPDWLDRINGKTLTSIVAVLPSVLTYMHHVAVGTRLHGITSDLDAHGLHVDPAAISTAIDDGAPEAAVATALQTASLIVAGDERAVTGHLARSFGRDQDQALGRLFAAAGGLIIDPAPLLDAAAAMADGLRGRRNSPQAFMAGAALRHHVARATGHTLDDQPASNANQRAFLRRSTAIGLILATDDPSIVDRYASDLTRDRLASRIELWSMLAYNRDVRPTPDFWLPRDVILRHTATEALRELAEFNDTYAAYLARCFVPAALQLDPSFGGRRLDLVAALKERAEHATEQQTITHLGHLAHELERAA